MTADELTPLLGLAAALRRAGLTIGPDRVVLAAESLAAMRASGDTDPYWPLRVVFCTRAADVDVFDEVYHGWFGAAAPSEETVVEAVDGGGGADGAGEGDGAGATSELVTRDVELLTEDELDRIKRWIGLLAPAPRRRRAMRHRRSRSGRVDVPPTMRLLLRHHGELVRVRFRRRVHRPRRLLFLVDVSGSMTGYDDVLLHFAMAAVAAGPRTTEVFAVGTGWTRLTEQLRARDPNAAMRAAVGVGSGWSLGTRLGRALRDFLAVWAGRSAVRSAVVVFATDGFEFDHQSLLREQVARLSRLAGDLVWVDPQRRGENWTPLDRDLAEAQSYADIRLSGHRFQDLRDLARVIGR